MHSNTESYPYTVTEGLYPVPPYGFNGDDTSSGYEYHTFAMELLPHEVRILMDSNVVWRGPDRLIPTSSPYYNWISQIPRSPVGIHPAEIDIDYDPSDPFGKDSSVAWIIGTDTGFNSSTFVERRYFDQHPNNPGFWDVTIGGKTYHAAHHLIDYVKIWDVPADVKVPDFPH